MMKLKKAVLIAGLALLPLTLTAAPYWGQKFDMRQPDGSRVSVYVWGDEYYARGESEDGYTLIHDASSKWLCYAELSPDGSDLASTGIKYTGKPADEKTKKAHANFPKQKKIKLKKEVVAEKVKRSKELLKGNQPAVQPAPGAIGTPGVPQPAPLYAVTRIGAYKGLTLLIAFPDLPGTIPQADVNNYCNQIGYKGFNNYGSIRDWFLAASEDKLDYTNHVTAYYTALHNKSYYTDTSIPYGQRARELVLEALNYLDAGGFDFSVFSVDGNNRIIALNVFYAGEPDCPWATAIWPHSGEVDPAAFCRDGVCAWHYQISNMGGELSIGTFIHENGHLLCSWPDLYDFDGGSYGTGYYDIMSGVSNKRPPMPNAFCRSRVGWGQLTDISPATNQVFSLQSNKAECLRYVNPSYAGEAFYFEARSKSGWNSNMAGEGLYIWHTDEDDKMGNCYEQMTCSQHYWVSLEQADGLFELERNLDLWGHQADIWTSAYPQGFTGSTTPNSNWWCDGASGLRVTEISAPGSAVSFRIGHIITPTPTPSVRMTINKTASAATVTLGDTITYTLAYQSIGTIAAPDARIWDTIPLQVGYLSSDPPGYFVGNIIVWDIGSVPPGTSGSVSWWGTVNAYPVRPAPASGKNDFFAASFHAGNIRAGAFAAGIRQE